MEQSPSQNIMPGLHRAPVDPGALPPPEYWTNFEPLYTTPDPSHQHAHPQQHHQQQQQQQLHQQPTPQPQSQPQQQPQQAQQQQSQQPLGISWDHPVFSQNPPSRSPLPTPQDQNHGLYSSTTPQSWRATALHPQPILPATAHPIGMTPQYRQAPQFSSTHAAYEAQPIAASDSAHFPPYTFSRSYYPPQNLSVPDVYAQSHSHSPPTAQAQPQTAHFRPDPHQHHVQYSLPAGYAEGNSHVPMNYPTEFTQSTPTGSEQTINPQYLSSAQQAANQQSSLHNNNNLLYLNPDEPKLYNFYREDLQMPPALGQSVTHNQPIAPKPQSAYEFVLPINGMLCYLLIGGIPLTRLGPNLSQSHAAAKGAKPVKKPATKKQSTLQPKKTTAKGANKKMDGAAESSESETDSSDSELEIENQDPEESSPLPATRPTEPEAAAKYDVLKAVWSPRNRRPNVDKVKSALVAFKDVVKTVRDAWKDSSQAMKAAENTGNNEEATRLKKDVVLQRRLMDVVVCATLEMGHPIIVEKLGEHPIAVAAMYSFLLDRHQAADFDGALTVNILKLLSRFVTMDEDVLQKTNVAKLLPRFVKKGGPAVKKLAQEIMDNAAASTKRKQDSAKPAAKDGSPSKQTSTVLGATASDGARPELAGSKRPRDAESNGQPATKRVVVTSNNKNASKPGGAVAAPKRPQDAVLDNKGASAQPSRPKTNIVAPKPTNLFGSLSSASKRPGTSNAERAAAAAAKTSNPPERREPQPAPPRPTFSFGDLMADLNKPKEPAPAQPAEPKTPETEEEREKRLRKEARRRLRVTWKPDESLTEVRLFTHDPDEELGPGDRMQREAGDVKGEGSVLKLHRDLDEEDDEEGGIREEQLLEYFVPSEIDFDEMPFEERGRNFIKRGGVEIPESAEKKAQEHREATTLMVFYTSPADVPSTPKEPPQPDTEEAVPDVVSFGEVPDHVMARQNRYFAAVKPQPPAAATPAPAPAPAATAQAPFDISNLLKIIQSAPQQPKSTPPPQTQPAPAPMSDLERTFSLFRQPQPQPQPASQPPMLQMPQFSAAPQAAAGQAIDLQNILAIMNAQKQMQPAATAPQAPPTQPSIAPNLAAIFSQINGQSQPGAGNMPQQSVHFEDPERKRLRETGAYDGADDDRSSYPKRNKYNDLGKKHPKAGSVPCRYWQSGKCRKGDECTYRHDPLI
ncbi:uncharacterized protein BO97DRAFT_375446 [Aspergillus homomorphus CBS 101889]|uniref:C3H1-type domain-containing protein n=1 Tax=Aspergillus homomorphus (strain CBS 101889) TaxID=1450537 RepID=A0A395HMB5_ASPHC|nr:hypothetical protein BO97DRAFT_375446 [Aspergillus homomorphus CBS 101889]RAL09082.1 hypothetical protein BO97DRAFT_375446 [Aspergillus homomorphus CBS 101889]